MFRRKDEWTEHFNNAHLALWWIPRGHRPTVAESAERLRKLDQLGPTAFAFTLKKPFPNPASG
jgi:hypothetical protein